MDSIGISEILNLSKEKKFEITCASFDVVDHIFKIDIPKPLRNRKLAVQAMSLLVNGNIQYGYEIKEENQKNQEVTEEALSESTEMQSVDEPLGKDDGSSMNNHEDNDPK